MHVVELTKKRIVFECDHPAAFVSLQVLTVEQEGDDSTQMCRVEASVTKEGMDAILSAEEGVLNDLRECSQRIFYAFRDEYTSMFTSAVVDANAEPIKVVLMAGIDARSLSKQVSDGQPEEYDIAATPDLVEVAKGKVQIIWTLKSVDVGAVGFESTACSRRNEVVDVAKDLRGKIDAIVGEEASLEPDLDATESMLARLLDMTRGASDVLEKRRSRCA